ncbi:MAG: IS3 family transposase, partial [Erysipelotrichaceae bacterium]|nr:IS3 family transposase [Erysipelotrichaceae bacterium]
QASGPNKDANLVMKAFNDIQGKLSDVDIFHTDRGSEFKNEKIEQLLISNNIRRSLSAKGKPIDNAVSESTYKIIKTEFAFNRKFNDLEELSLELFDYVNWFNNKRKHGSLNYKTPVQFRLSL